MKSKTTNKYRCSGPNCIKTLTDDNPILIDMYRCSNQELSFRAELLMQKYNYKPTDRLCVKCFWGNQQ